MAQTNGLLNRHRGSTSIEGSNPSLSASILKQVCKYLLFYWLKPFRDLGTKLTLRSITIEGSPKGTHLCPSDFRRNPSLSAKKLNKGHQPLVFYASMECRITNCINLNRGMIFQNFEWTFETGLKPDTT